MERTERYLKYKLIKYKTSANAKLNSITYDLTISINNGPLQEVIVQHYKIGNYIHILSRDPREAGIASSYYLNQANINSTIENELLITVGRHNIRIIFPVPEARTLFLEEIRQDGDSSSEGSSTSSEGSSTSSEGSSTNSEGSWNSGHVSQ